jgi:hypothetical protein
MSRLPVLLLAVLMLIVVGCSKPVAKDDPSPSTAPAPTPVAEGLPVEMAKGLPVAPYPHRPGDRPVEEIDLTNEDLQKLIEAALPEIERIGEAKVDPKVVNDPLAILDVPRPPDAKLPGLAQPDAKDPAGPFAGRTGATKMRLVKEHGGNEASEKAVALPAKLVEEQAKPVERPVPVGPGIQALASASTDIIVADVVETNPSKAEEGARDTVKLKVVRTLLGRPAVGDTLGVYYHLLWADEKGETLEPPKFEKGKRYVVFLRSHVEDRREEGKRVAYELTDQWLAVRPDHVRLVKEVAAAVRVAHGDARGEWSSTDGSMAGLQGRLVVYRDEPSNGTPILAVYLDVRNTSGGNNTVEFAPERSGAKWAVTDANGKAVTTTIPPGNWQPAPRLKLVLASGESGRLRLNVTGSGIMKDKGGHLELASDRVWVFDRGDKGPYYLSGTITVAPTGGSSWWWSGTLDLPKVRLPLGTD